MINTLNRLGVALLATLTLSGVSWAEQPGGAPASQASTTLTQLSAAQRATIAQELIAKFSNQVAKTPKGDVAAWSSKLTKLVATADASNILRATTMPTLDTMHATLNGAALDSRIMSAMTSDGRTSQTLGSLVADTTYTPLPHGRCRIADSRVIASPLAANVERAIDVEDIASYASQGGVGTYANGDGSTNCGIPSFATAYVVSVLLIQPAANAQLKIFANGDPKFEGNTVLANTGRFSSNEMIVESCQSCGLELAVLSNAQTHYVIDIMGYFMPPEATALQCVTTAETTLSLPASGTGNLNAPVCPAGYTQTATNCAASSWLVPFVYFKDGTCSARNNSGGAENIRASRTCCRVPGR